jgi:hypothetical protein
MGKLKEVFFFILQAMGDLTNLIVIRQKAKDQNTETNIRTANQLMIDIMAKLVQYTEKSENPFDDIHVYDIWLLATSKRPDLCDRDDMMDISHYIALGLSKRHYRVWESINSKGNYVISIFPDMMRYCQFSNMDPLLHTAVTNMLDKYIKYRARIKILAKDIVPRVWDYLITNCSNPHIEELTIRIDNFINMISDVHNNKSAKTNKDKLRICERVMFSLRNSGLRVRYAAENHEIVIYLP